MNALSRPNQKTKPKSLNVAAAHQVTDSSGQTSATTTNSISINQDSRGQCRRNQWNRTQYTIIKEANTKTIHNIRSRKTTVKWMNGFWSRRTKLSEWEKAFPRNLPPEKVTAWNGRGAYGCRLISEYEGLCLLSSSVVYCLNQASLSTLYTPLHVCGRHTPPHSCLESKWPGKAEWPCQRCLLA